MKKTRRERRETVAQESRAGKKGKRENQRLEIKRTKHSSRSLPLARSLSVGVHLRS